MRARLFLDEDIHFGLAATLRKRGYDVVHAQESGRKGRSDGEQLDYAVDDGRCLVSFNVKDFVLLHNRYVENRREHRGIAVLRQVPFGEAMKKLLRLINEHTPDTIKNRLIFL